MKMSKTGPHSPPCVASTPKCHMLLSGKLKMQILSGDKLIYWLGKIHNLVLILFLQHTLCVFIQEFISGSMDLSIVFFLNPSLTGVLLRTCRTISFCRGSRVSRNRKPPPPAPARLWPRTSGLRASIMALTEAGSQPGAITFFCCLMRSRHKPNLDREPVGQRRESHCFKSTGFFVLGSF